LILNVLFRLTQSILDRIQENLDENYVLTLFILIAIVRDEFEVIVCAATMQRAVGKFRYSLKRSQNITIAIDSPANEALRLDSARWYIRITLAGRKFIFIDDVGFQSGCISTTKDFRHRLVTSQ
jgi:hypothetical protein